MFTQEYQKTKEKKNEMKRTKRNTFTSHSNAKDISLMLLSRGFIKIDPIKLLTYGINTVDKKVKA